MALPTAEQPGLDEHTPPQMAAWLRETAANTRKHSDPAWCAARALLCDPVAAHVAFRMEQAADLFERLTHRLDRIEKIAANDETGCTACVSIIEEIRELRQ